MKDRSSLSQRISTSLLSAFPDSTSDRVQKDVAWALKRWNQEVEFTIDFLSEGEYPEIGILCSTPDAVYQSDTENAVPPDGFLWRTNRRILFVSKTGGGLFKTAKPLMLEFALSSLTSIKHLIKGKLFKESLIVLYISTTSASGKVAEISFRPHGICTPAADHFVTNVQEYRTRLANMPTKASTTNTQETLLTSLERLRQLREQNVLSEEEFILAKKKLLG